MNFPALLESTNVTGTFIQKIVSVESIFAIGGEDCVIGKTLADDDPQPLVAVIAIEKIFSCPAKLYPQEASSKV